MSRRRQRIAEEVDRKDIKLPIYDKTERRKIRNYMHTLKLNTSIDEEDFDEDDFDDYEDEILNK
jgi:hypothetical protein